MLLLYGYRLWGQCLMSRNLVFFRLFYRYVKATFHKRFPMLVRNQHCSAFRYAYDSRGNCSEGAVIKFDSHRFFRCSFLSLVCPLLYRYRLSCQRLCNLISVFFQNFWGVFLFTSTPPVGAARARGGLNEIDQNYLKCLS